MNLKLKNISKSYDMKPIVRDITMDFALGEVVGIFGPNGAGKTTLFSIIIGLLKADVGKIYLGDYDITNLPIYLRSQLGISYLAQESSVFRGLTVKDNILAILEIANLYLKHEEEKINIEDKLDQLMQDFSISHLANNMASSLSGGEKRRLEIARCLATSPKFIMLDEPLAGIDPLAINDIKNLVGQLKNFNTGIIITDHNVRDTLDLVDRAYIVYNGEILTSGSSAEIIADDRVREVYLGKNFTN